MTTKFSNMKFNIGNDPECNDPECSERVQKVLFSLGYKWNNPPYSVVRFEDKPYLFTDNRGQMYYGDYEDGFEVFIDYEKINIDWLRTPTATVEVNGKRYLLSDIEKLEEVE